MKTLGYYNGAIDELEKMSVPMLDRACYFGDGVYDATYTHDYRLFTLNEHVDRFYRSANLAGIGVPISKEELKALLNSLVAKMDDGDLFVYWQVTRGTALRDHPYGDLKEGNLWAMIKPAKMKDLTQKISLISVEDTRFQHCNIKTLNLLPNVMAAERARLQGCDEAVFYRDDAVTECAHSNIHILRKGALYTHPADHHILEGVARGRLIAACRRLGVPVYETPFTLGDTFGADEVLVTSAGSLCLSASSLDGVPVGGKAPKLLQKLQESLLREFLTATEK